MALWLTAFGVPADAAAVVAGAKPGPQASPALTRRAPPPLAVALAAAVAAAEAAAAAVAAVVAGTGRLPDSPRGVRRTGAQDSAGRTALLRSVRGPEPPSSDVVALLARLVPASAAVEDDEGVSALEAARGAGWVDAAAAMQVRTAARARGVRASPGLRQRE